MRWLVGRKFDRRTASEADTASSAEMSLARLPARERGMSWCDRVTCNHRRLSVTSDLVVVDEVLHAARQHAPDL
jgi:hypothetical protein